MANRGPARADGKLQALNYRDAPQEPLHLVIPGAAPACRCGNPESSFCWLHSKSWIRDRCCAASIDDKDTLGIPHYQCGDFVRHPGTLAPPTAFALTVLPTQPAFAGMTKT